MCGGVGGGVCGGVCGGVGGGVGGGVLAFIGESEALRVCLQGNYNN